MFESNRALISKYVTVVSTKGVIWKFGNHLGRLIYAMSIMSNYVDGKKISIYSLKDGHIDRLICVLKEGGLSIREYLNEILYGRG